MFLLIVALMFPHSSSSGDPSIKYDVIPNELPWYRYKDLDYYVDTRILVTYTEAASTCESLGGSLPILDSVGKRNYVLSLIPTLARPPYSFHIGLKCESVNGNWTHRWYSGTESNYNADDFHNQTKPLKPGATWWAQGQPWATKHGVVVMGRYDSYEPTFKWRIVFLTPLESITLLMCQREAYNPVNSDPPPPLTLDKPDDLDIKLFLRPSTLSDVTWVSYPEENVNVHISFTRPVASRKLGDLYCADLDAKLVSVKTDVKQKFLVQQFRAKNATLWRDHAFFIGLKRSKDSSSLNKWLWPDNELLTNAHWFPSEPKVVRHPFDFAAREYACVQMGGNTAKRSNENFLWLNVIGRTKPFEIETYPVCQRRWEASYSVSLPDYSAINAGKTYNWTGKYYVYIDDPYAPITNITTLPNNATTTTLPPLMVLTAAAPEAPTVGLDNVTITYQDAINIVEIDDDVTAAKNPIVKLLEAVPLGASSRGVVTGVVLGGLALILIGLTAGYFVIVSINKSEGINEAFVQDETPDEICSEVSESSSEDVEVKESSSEQIESVRQLSSRTMDPVLKNSF